MSKVDPTLRFLQVLESDGERELLDQLDSLRTVTGVEEEAKTSLLIEFEGEMADLERLGFEERCRTGNILSGQIPLSRLNELSNLPGVIFAEGPRPMVLELDNSVEETECDHVHAEGKRGKGALIGIIDSGIDIHHQCFWTQEEGEEKKSRILSIWDQKLTPRDGESAPSEFNFGVEYDREAIESALNERGEIRHRETASGHGTHVAGIAAGNGDAPGSPAPAGTFVGVAPEADLIVVANRVGDLEMGNSTNTFDAVHYLLAKARAMNRPIVINHSQGDNLGPHDGTSLLEKGIDSMLGDRPGRCMIKSAGNAANDAIHASGSVEENEEITVRFQISGTPPLGLVAIDLWYLAGDEFSFQLKGPGGVKSPVVAPGDEQQKFTLQNGQRLVIVSTLGSENNGDNRIFFSILPDLSGRISIGTWRMILKGESVENGNFDAWIERKCGASFSGKFQNNERTITIPGTARRIITVGSYSNQGLDRGKLSNFSSQGPTRDERSKPDLAAPGAGVVSARSDGNRSGSGHYIRQTGTSMAAPHVAGTAALMFAENPNLTAFEIREALLATCRTDEQTGDTPSPLEWGKGKLDVRAALDGVAREDEY